MRQCLFLSSALETSGPALGASSVSDDSWSLSAWFPLDVVTVAVAGTEVVLEPCPPKLERKSSIVAVAGGFLRCRDLVCCVLGERDLTRRRLRLGEILKSLTDLELSHDLTLSYDPLLS